MTSLSLIGWLAVAPGPAPAAPACSTGDEAHVLSVIDWERLNAPPRALEDTLHVRRVETLERLAHILSGDVDYDTSRREMLLRAASVYLDEGLYLRAREREAEQAACRACRADPACVDVPAVDSAGSTRSLKAAQRLSAQVLERAPQYERHDEATFVQGRAQLGLDQDAAATATLTGLVKTWPDSAYAAPAYMLLGELFEANHEIEKAQLSWTRAARAEGLDSAFAHYRQAWTWSARGEGEPALAELSLVLDTPGLPAAFQDELTRSLIWFYADAGRTDALVLALAHKEGRDPADAQLNARLAAPPTSPLVWSALVGVADRLVQEGQTSQADLLALAVMISLKRLEQVSPVDAAGAYVRFAVDLPRPGIADQALYEAALIFERQHEPEAATALRRALITLWPESPYAADTRRRLDGAEEGMR